jgi:hypothetical protein
LSASGTAAFEAMLFIDAGAIIVTPQLLKTGLRRAE